MLDLYLCALCNIILPPIIPYGRHEMSPHIVMCEQTDLAPMNTEIFTPISLPPLINVLKLVLNENGANAQKKLK